MKKLSQGLALLSTLLSALLLIKNKLPQGIFLWMPKLFAGAVAPWNALLAVFAALLAWFNGAKWTSLLSSLAALLSARYVYLVSRSPPASC